ncbi:HAMP domain-containing protein [Haloarcula amylolytica]|uniref:HAMP domain-containing protein n=1 Tax=Haloarcula amylolytica TaxID=396317 RepID=UPI003C7188D4
MSIDDTQTTDSTDIDSNASGGILATVVPDFIRRNFALKFGIVLFIMALSVGLVGLAATEQVRDYTEQQVLSDYENAAAQEANILSQWVDRNRLSTQFVSSDDVWASSDTDDIAIELNNRKASLSADASDIHLVERGVGQSEVVASTSNSEVLTNSPLDSTNRAWLTEANFETASDVVVSDVYQTNSGPVVGFGSPVDASQNRYILIEYSLDEIANSFQGSNRAEGGFTQVVNSSAVVMIDEPKDGSRGVGESMLQPYSADTRATEPIDAANDLRSSEQQSGVDDSMPETDVLSERYTVGYAPIQGTDWVVLVHAPNSAVFGFVQNVQQYGLIGTALMVLLIAGVGAILGYNTATSIDRLTRKTDQMRQGNLDVDISTSRIDNIGRLYSGFADMRDALKEQINEAERAQKEAEVSRAEALEVNKYLQKKAEEFSDVMEETAAGNLTERMATDGENESMDRIASEFNGMVDELEKTIGQLNSFADEVAESGSVVLSSAESVRDASEQVAESTQKISDDAYDQKDRLASISEELDTLVDTLEELEANNPDVDLGDSLERFRTVATTLQSAAETSDQMMAETQTVAGAAEEQAAELNEVSSRAEQLKRYAKPLGDILNRFETEAEHEFVFSGGPSQSLGEEEEE